MKLGRYTNDYIERQFGKWRQSAGGNYYISVAEVVHSNRIHWSTITNMFLGRSHDLSTSSHNCEFCIMEPTDVFELDITSRENHQTLAACAYIGGYLCHQFQNLPSVAPETSSSEAYEFTKLLDRGGLKYPAESVVTWVAYCHNLFDELSPHLRQCRTYLIKTFEIVDDVFDTNIEDERIYRTLANIFSNNYCRSYNQGRPSLPKVLKLN